MDTQQMLRDYDAFWAEKEAWAKYLIDNTTNLEANKVELTRVDAEKEKLGSLSTLKAKQRNQFYDLQERGNTLRRRLNNCCNDIKVQEEKLAKIAKYRDEVREALKKLADVHNLYQRLPPDFQRSVDLNFTLRSAVP